MKFEVVNDKNRTMMSTVYWSCVYNEDTLRSISKSGYKFKLDGKIISLKKLIEKLKEIDGGEDN